MVQNPFDDGSASRFQGDRTLLLQSIPANASIEKATATITPVDPSAGTDPFAETINFSGNSGDLGATQTQVTGTPSWAEVDFHARRTLATVEGTGFDAAIGAALQVDVGAGIYVEINDAGAFRAPAPGNNPFLVKTSPAPLPPLTVTRMKLTQNAAPKITRLKIRSAPTNVSLKLGGSSAFWSHPGEMSRPETTPDFAATLQTALPRFKVVNGYYAIPFVLHSDTLARFQVALEIDFVYQQSAIPAGLKDVVQSFDYGGTAKPESDVLQVAIPSNSNIASDGTTARVKGGFDETRVVFGPTGDVTPISSGALGPNISLAQAISFSSDLSVTAVDLFLSVTDPTISLRLDILTDLDGKPADTSLLTGPAKLSVQRPASGQPVWASIPLPAKLQLHAVNPATKQPKRYWIVLQSLDGAALWNATAAVAGNPAMQRNSDGLSWRDVLDEGSSKPLAGLLRLRDKPTNFQVPIALQAGKGDQAVRVNLDRFAPLQRVDLTIDAELAQGVQMFLANSKPAASGGCPQGEQLANGNFAQWTITGDAIGSAQNLPTSATTAAGLIAGVPASPSPGDQVIVAPDGSIAYVETVLAQESSLQAIDVLCDRPADMIPIGNGQPGSFAIHPSGTRAFATTAQSSAIVVLDLSAKKALGSPVQLAQGIWVQHMALAPDGSKLYVVIQKVVSGDIGPQEVDVIDTGLLVQAALGQKPAPTLRKLPLPPGTTAMTTIDALIPTADGEALYALLDKATAKPSLVNLLLSTSTAIPLAGAAVGFTLTLDGSRAIVALKTGDIYVVGLSGGTPPAPLLKLTGTPAGIALSPDGARAFIPRSDKKVDVVNLTRGTASPNPITTAIGSASQGIAVTPQGDRIYITGGGSIQFIPIGFRQPADWAVTSGTVGLQCVPGAGPVMVLGGLIPPPGGGIKPPPPASDTGVSQVVPAHGGCPYELSFLALAANDGAIAELLWSASDCTALPASDPIPIHAGARTATASQRVRVTAPAGATQAELRFQVPAGNVAVVGQASLVGASGALTNADLNTLTAGKPDGWTVQAAQSAALTFVDTGTSVQITNGGNATADLFQKLTVQSGNQFSLELHATATQPADANASATTQNARLELHWFDASNTPIPPSPGLDIAPGAFDYSAASGTVPGTAASAEIHLLIPAAVALNITAISLQLFQPATVSISFVAQSPGNLTVSTMNVAYEPAAPTPVPIPPGGLCPPTPPPQAAQASHNSCFCCCCGTQRPMKNPKPTSTQGGRPSTTGTCAQCGTTLTRPGGQITPGLTNIPPTFTYTHPAVPVTTNQLVSIVEGLQATASGQTGHLAVGELTRVTGIGHARAAQLEAAGITTLQQLATSDKEKIAAILEGPGMSLDVAQTFIDQANKLLEAEGV
jgi:DNA-binding beta-propeller fold protein YncE/predicted flap endonuclease-1-like 5' DNA nuclease